MQVNNGVIIDTGEYFQQKRVSNDRGGQQE